jgi:hypothetical protein
LSSPEPSRTKTSLVIRMPPNSAISWAITPIPLSAEHTM